MFNNINIATLLVCLFFSNQVKSQDIKIDLIKSQKIDSKTSNGRWNVDLAWVYVDVIVDSFDALRGIISFTPNHSAPQCERITFIQTAKVLDNELNDYIWPNLEAPRNEIMTKSSFGVNKGFFVDHLASECQKGKSCSPYYRDYWPNEEDGSNDGYKNGEDISSAVLVDYPYGWEEISSIKLEACAVCADNQFVYSCFNWGGSWPVVGERV